MSSVNRRAPLPCIAICLWLAGCTQSNQAPAIIPTRASLPGAVPATATEIQSVANYLKFCFTVIKRSGKQIWVSSDAASNLTLMPWRHVVSVGSCFKLAGVKDADAAATYCVQSIVEDGVVFSFKKGRSDGGVTIGQVKLKWTPLPAPRVESKEDKYQHNHLISCFSVFSRKANQIRVVVKPNQPLTLRAGISDIGVGHEFNRVEEDGRYHYRVKAIEADGAVISYKGDVTAKQVAGDVKLKWKP